MTLKIKHKTIYYFETGVSSGLQQMRKVPQSDDLQKVLDWTVSLSGAKRDFTFKDHFGNHVELLSLIPGIKKLSIECKGTVDVQYKNGIRSKCTKELPLWCYKRHTQVVIAGPETRKILKHLGQYQDVGFFHRLMKLIRDKVEYEKDRTDVNTNSEQALKQGKGVCQDFTHIFLACSRSMGFPARYISGFLLQNKQMHQDAMHAWAEVFLDGLGWVGFDTANGISPDEKYVKVAKGLDYFDAAPIKGARFGGKKEKMFVKIEVAEQ